jgi:hypothetical protein
MENKKVIGVLGLLAVVGALTGCEQVATQTQNTAQQTSTTQQATVATQDEYTVDESDNIKPHTLLGVVATSELTDAEAKGLIQMREEEKLAHDVYVTLYDKWGQNTFNNISKSEQTHTDTIKYLLDKYEIDDPVKDTTVGVFTDPTMQKLYDDLVVQGSKSLEDALVVGATVEDLDIKDLEDWIAKTDNEDILIAYQNLMKGSRNHMRAFIRVLERNGGEYTPQYISQTEYQEILASQQERGSVDGQGQGNGQRRGQGRGQGGGGRGINSMQE